MLVSGEAGVGKSRLVAEVLAGCESRLLHGSAVLGRGGYGPVREVVRSLRDEIDAADLPLGPLLSELGPSATEIDGAVLVDALRRALRRAAGTGSVVVVIEDLHWADAATIDLLPPLAAALTQESVLIVATYRSDQLPRAHPLRRARSELRRGRGLRSEIALRPLAKAQTEALCTALLGRPVSAGLLTAVHSRSDGLPFFVEELAATLVETGSLREIDGSLDIPADTDLPLSDSVVDAVLARTAELKSAYPDAVELAAVLGVRVDLTALAELVPPAEVDDLLDSGLLVERGRAESDTAVFRHALVQEALHGAIPWARRRAHHDRVARYLSRRGASPEVVAEHWIAAHEYERARPLLLSAAERHCAVHAYRDAARLARRALQVWPERVDPSGRMAVLEQLAACAELCDEYASAAEAWTAVGRLRQAAGDWSGVGMANRRLATARELLGDWSGAITAREDAAASFTASGASGEAAEERLALAERLWSAAHNTRALEHAVAATEDAEVADRDDLRARAMAIQGGVRATMGEGDRGVQLARDGLALAMRRQRPELAGEAHYQLAAALLYAGDYASAARAYESAAELCREHDITELSQACSACLGVVVRIMGEWDRALLISANVLGSDHSPQEVRMVAQEELGLVNALRGDARRARGPLRRAAAFGRAHEIFGIEVGAMWGLALLADADGDDAAASREVSAILQRCSVKEEWHFALPALRWASTFLAERVDGERGAQCHRLLATAATRDSSPKVLSALAHAGGDLALARGEAAQAAAQFGRAVDLLEGVAAPYEKALSQLRWGAALAADGRRQAAVDKVTSAYRTARQLGAKPLARECVSRLAAMGEQVDRRLGRLAARALEPAGLTPREKEVLCLLGSDRTNRQIAAELFISPRTVDMHVRNVLAKLGCTSRVAAVRRGVELGVVGNSPVLETRQ